MMQNTKEPLNERLKQEMKRRKVSVPDFELQTGLPKDRVYKWLKRGTGNIKHEDASIIEDWLSGHLDNPPLDKLKKGQKEPLEVAIQNLTEADLINAKNIERLIGLLEHKISLDSLPEPGQEGTIPIGKKKAGV